MRSAQDIAQRLMRSDTDFPDRNRTDSLSYVPFLSLHQHPAWEVIRNLDSFPFLRVCCRGFELFGQDWKAKSQSSRIKNGIFWYDFAGWQIPLLRSVPSFIYRTEGTYLIDVTVLTFSPSVTSPVHRCPLPLPITWEHVLSFPYSQHVEANGYRC